MIGIAHHGSVVLVGPDADDHLAFADWLADNVGEEVTFWGDALVCSPHSLPALVYGLIADGFEVEGI